MKHLTVLIFSVFYLMFSSGAAFQVHICSAGVKDCCKTVLKFIKVDKFQKAKPLDFNLDHSPVLQAARFFGFNEDSAYTEYILCSLFAHSPLQIHRRSIFILNCNFRI